MRLIDGDKLKRKVQRIATEAWMMKLTASVETTLNQFIDYIDEAPTIDKPQWIPCSERLPTKAGHYLCSFKKPKLIDNIYVDLAYWTGGRWYGYLAPEIKAWMPLPEPWKGADDE